MSREVASAVRVIGGILAVVGVILSLSSTSTSSLAQFALVGGLVAFVVGSFIVGNIDSKRKWAERDRAGHDREV